MAGSTVPIAPIPLARSRGRLLAAPLIILVAGSAAVAGGALMGDLWGIGMVSAGVIVIVLSCYLALKLISVRLDVEVATLRLRWLGGEHRYTLVRGPVTRVALRGREAARLRPRFGALGWGLGRAKLRRNEPIELVRLARTSTMILVPTDRGRVGIAPASEQQLLNALAAAARIQQRLDEVAERARAFVTPLGDERTSMPAGPRADAAAGIGAQAAPAAASAGPRVLTGIERTLLEEHLATERAAALHAAEAERQAGAAAAVRMEAFLPAETIAPPPALPARVRRRSQWHRPSWLPFGGATAAAAPPIDTAAAVPAAPVPTAPAPTAPAPAIPAQTAPAAVQPAVEPRPVAVPGERLAAYTMAVVPAVVAGVIWVVATIGGRLELPAEQLRTMALALLAAGPAGALAGLIARTWYPRLLGVVALTSLATLGLIGRALLG